MNSGTFGKILASIGVWMLLAVSSGYGQQAQSPEGDYGDAPDALYALYQNVNPEMIAQFPSGFDESGQPLYIYHRFPSQEVFLGKTVTSERDAILINQDKDDGWLPQSFSACSTQALSVEVTLPETASGQAIYLNVAFDWDQDGVWSGVSACDGSSSLTQEWVIQNLRLDTTPYLLKPGSSRVIQLPEILIGPSAGEAWSRFTISTEPVNTTDWNGVGNFEFGETEDHLLCVFSGEQVLDGCPTMQTEPFAANLVRSTPMDQAVDILLPVLDMEGNNIECRIERSDLPQSGNVEMSDACQVTYTPESGFSGEDQFSYRVEDPLSNLFKVAQVTVQVDNESPTAQTIILITPEDESLPIQLFGEDPDEDLLIYSLDTEPFNGVLGGNLGINEVDSVTGQTLYTPNLNFNGLDFFLYRVDDGNGGFDSALVLIQVTPVNDVPEAVDDVFVNPNIQTIAFNVTNNDFDVDGDVLVVSSFTQPPNGTVSCAGAICIYTPDDEFDSGFDSFTYTTDDRNGGTDTATVTIRVGNLPPTTVNDSATTNEDVNVTISVLANDSDIDGDPFSVTGNTQPTNGSVSCNATQCVYNPDQDFFGTDSFSYTASDNLGGASQATVTVTVNARNDAPVANDDSGSTNEDTPITVNVLLNDSDVEGNSLSVSATTNPSNGSVNINGNNTIRYTPDSDFHGTDSFSYTLRDSVGATDTATVTVTVASINDAPDAVDDNVSTNEDNAISVTVLSNDSDVDGDTLNVTITTDPSDGSIQVNNNIITYTPDNDFNGSDSFTYTISDGNGGTDTATVNVSVNAINDAPVAQDDSVSTNEDTAITVSVLDNDSDVDLDTLSISATTNPSNGAIQVNGGTTITYTPNSDYHGADTFTYTVSDGAGGTDTATVNITVNSINDNPVAVDDNINVNEDDDITFTVLDNDSDVDGDTINVTSTTNPSNGTINVVGNSITYTPDVNFDGSDAFTYTISDGAGGTATATVNITINPFNDPPAATDDSATVDEDNPVTISVLSNDSDQDGDSVSVSATTNPANGLVQVNGGTTITYTPNQHFNGSDSFTYTLSDGNGGFDTATVNVTVNAVNDNPDASDDTASTNEDNNVTISVLTNDGDLDGDSISVNGTTDPANGSVQINGATTITYMPDQHFNGSDSFTYTISDGAGGTDTATVNVTVNPINDVPVAQNDAAGTSEDNSVVISVLSNDSDIDLDTLTITATTDPSSGNVQINSGTTITYTPDSDFNGNDNFTYTISDGNGGTDTATVNVSVGAINDAPEANDDVASVDEDSSVVVSVLSNDTDLDGDSISVLSTTDPSNGSVQVNSGTTVTYTPDQHFNGSDSFTYTISDGNGGTDTATVNVTVNSINDVPVANLDSTGTNEDNAVIINVLSNDTDIDGDTLTITATTDPSNGNVQINSGTTITYMPDSDFNGQDSFMYTISDGNGGQANTTVTVNVAAINDAPVAGDDSDSVDEDSNVLIPVLDNDSDVDLDTLSISSAGTSSNGTVQITGGTAITYTPNPNFNGSDSFTYTVSDSSGGTDTATVNVTVNAVNDDPTANNDSANTDEDMAVTINVLTNDGDIDAGDSISIAFNTDPSSGSVTCNLTSCTYTPDGDFNGSDSFMYTIGDGNGGSDTATVTVVVGATNDAPDAVNDSATTDEDNAITISVLSNDSDIDGDALSISGSTNPSNGSIVVNGNNTITYTPTAHYFGSDSFTYTITDGNGGSDTATANVTVNSVNDVPAAVDDSATTDEDNEVIVSVLNNDSDIDGDTLTVTTTSSSSNGNVQIDGGTTITYMPDSDFNGSDSFTYTISDGNGGTNTATVNVTVNPINDAPVAIDNTVSVDEDNNLTISVLSNDSDVDGDTITVIGTSDPANGSVQVNGGTTINYMPDSDFNGSDSFTYTISDGNGGTNTATVNITVNSINDNPIAGDDSAITDEDNAVVISVLTNDTDVDLDSLTVTGASDPANGSVQINNGTTITYTPDQHFNGFDSFTYTIIDGNGGTDTATVNVTVNAINDAPDAQDDSDSVDEDNPVTISVLSNDNDVDGDTMTVSSTSSASNGSVQINGGTTITYMPDSDFNGSDSFTYTIIDGNGGSDTATVNITVNAINDAPIANDDSASTNEDNGVIVSVMTNDTDVDLDTLTVTSTTSPANGSVQINSATTITYTPDQHFFGSDSFTYTISDGAGGTDTAIVNVTVNSVNDVPVANTDNATTDEDDFIVINVLSNDTDADGDSLDVTTLTQPMDGSAQLNGNDTITYTPDSDFNGSDSFTYTIDDGKGGITVGSVVVTVNAINDAPVANDDSANINEDNDVIISVLTNDTDVDLDTLTVTGTTSPSNGSVQINSGTTITYTPVQHFFGSDSFTYTISDAAGGTDTATVNVTISSVNDVPVANTDNATTDEDDFIVINVLTNDTDADGDSLTVTGANAPSNGSVQVNGGATITYTPDNDFNGSDSFTYTIIDGNGGTNTGTVNVTVNAINDAPVAVDDAAGTNEDNAVMISVLVNDSDVDLDTMTVTTASSPSNGSVQINSGTTITYTPNQHYFGADSFTYTISDGAGGTDTATVNVTVSSVNDAPDVVADSASTNEDTTVIINVLSNDSDVESDMLTVDSATDPANGNVVVNGNNTITYMPDSDFNGADSFTYTVSDGNGGNNTALVSITVNAVNDNPVANTDIANTNEDNAIIISALSNDTDVDLDGLTVISTSSASNGTVQINSGTTITYMPNAHYFGADSFTYTIEDGNGGSATGTVNVTVISVNDAPAANDDTASTNEDEAVLINVLSNDSDVEGDLLTISGNTNPSNGAVLCGATNCTYTPNNHFFGNDSFTYTIGDGNGGVDTGTVNITISSINDAPDANDDGATTDEDNAVIVSVLANDSDVEGDTLSVDSATSPSNGTVNINGDNTITYTPSADFFGSDSFSYTVVDGQGGSSNATVNITINAVNDNPVAVDDNAATDEDNAVNIDVLDNDSDVDLNTLTVDSTTSPSSGSVFVEADNTITYTPNLNFSGADSFTYTVIDGQGGSATATANIAVGALNDAPVAVADSVSTDEDNAVLISVLSNDSDVEGDTLTITTTTSPNNGTVQINDGTTITYTPDADSFGNDSFVYTVEDGNGGADTATVNITVNPINDNPVANTDDVSTNEDNALIISVLTNDSDVDGDTFSVSGTTDPSNGSINLNVDDTITYTPNTHFFGNDSFSYTIEDGNGGTDTATVNVTINAVNDVPVAVDDSASTDEDTSVNIDVLGDDSDVDLDNLSVSNTTTPSNGSVIIETDNTITYTPSAHFFGNDSFVYTVIDGNGGADTATVNITINPVNDAPDAADDSASVNEDEFVIVTVLTNDSDVDGDSVDVTSVSSASNGTTQLNVDDTITYTPNTHFNGNDSFTYTVIDGNGGTDTATVNITINAINDAPVASDDSATTDEDTSVIITVLSNDSDVDLDILNVSSAGPASNGSVVINGGTTISYTPNLNFNGADSFSYTVEDGNGGTATATVNITINAVNDAPDAVADSVGGNEDNSLNINVLVNDSDVEGDSLDVTTTTTPANGSVVVETNDTITYTPDPHFNGVDSFDYTVIDGNGGVSNATVMITVNSINDVPVANDDSDSTNEDTQVAIDVAANDTDADGDTLSVDSHSQGSNGSVSCVGGICTYMPNADFNGVDTFTYTIGDGNGGSDTATVNLTINAMNDDPVAVDDSAITDEDVGVVIDVLTNDSDVEFDTLTVTSTSAPTKGTTQINGDNTITYTPNISLNGSDSFTYTVEDGNGGSATATVNITINSINDAPVANDDSDSVDEDNPITIDVVANDVDDDIGDVLTATVNAQPSNGSANCSVNDCTYTPDPNFNGVDSFTYLLEDGQGGSDTGTVTITVNSINDIPVAVDDSASVDEDNNINFIILSNDSDDDGDTLTISSNTQPSNGSVVVETDDTVTYTPNAHFNGIDTFTYTVDDSNGGSDTATVMVTVNSVNDLPVANDDNVVLDEDVETDIVVVSNDTDDDGDTLTVDSHTQPGSGSVSCVGGTCTFTPSANFFGADNFTYTITDGNGAFDTATVNLTVTPVNDAPVANANSDTLDEDTFTTIAVLLNDSDVEGDSISITSNTQGSNGAVSCTVTDCTYTPSADFFGADSFTYTIDDGNGGTAVGNVDVTVTNINDMPVANDDSATIDEDDFIAIDVISNDVDVDGDTLTITNLTFPSDGNVNCTGAVCTYTPDANFNGVDSFTYTINDGNGQTDTATVTITINSIQDAPVANDDTSPFILEDFQANIGVLLNDFDPDGDPFSLISNTDPANGTVVCTTSCTYTPDPNFNGNDSFTYTIEDSTGLQDTASVSLTVLPRNDSPTAVDDSVNTDEDMVIIIDVLSNDFDVDGDTLTLQSNTTPSNGGVVCSTTCTYTPNTNFFGSDSFSYTINDGNGKTNSATVNITINAVNDDPVANTDSDSVDEDDSVIVDVLINDTDADGDSLIIINNTQGSNGAVVCGGTCTYTPNADFNGADSFTYTVDDSNGGQNVGTVNITVNPINDAPTAVDDMHTLDEDTVANIVVTTNDTDVDGDTLSATLLSNAARGNVVCVSDTCTYTPDAHFNGVDSFTYTVDDGNGGSDTATVDLTIISIPDPTADPDAVDDNAVTDEDMFIDIDVLANDSDSDGDPINVAANTQPSNGTASCAGSICTYTPDPDFFGADSFMYTVEDGQGGFADATVNVTVNSVNDLPVANDDSAILDEDDFLSIDVLTNDTDLEGDILSVLSSTNPSNGTVLCSATECTYTPSADFNGNDSFTYTVDDGNGGTDIANVDVTINAINDAPVSVDDAISTDEEMAVIVDVLANDSDVDLDSISITTTFNLTPNGSVSCVSTQCTYTPDNNFFGADNFSYDISDGNGGTATANVTVTVNPINDAPVANDDIAPFVLEDSQVNVSVLSNDFDPDGDLLTVTIDSLPSNGTVIVMLNNTIDYIPDSNFFGVDSFTYMIDDGNGLTDTAMVDVTVLAKNDKPVAVDDSAITDEDVAVVVDVLTNDTDVEGDSLTIISNSQGTNGAVSCTATDCTYTPNAGFDGSDSFTYTIDDGNGGTDTGTVNVTVNATMASMMQSASVWPLLLGILLSPLTLTRNLLRRFKNWTMKQGQTKTWIPIPKSNIQSSRTEFFR